MKEKIEDVVKKALFDLRRGLPFLPIKSVPLQAMAFKTVVGSAPALIEIPESANYVEVSIAVAQNANSVGLLAFDYPGDLEAVISGAAGDIFNGVEQIVGGLIFCKGRKNITVHCPALSYIFVKFYRN